MVDLSRGFQQVDRSFVEPDLDASLEAFYVNEFFPPLATNLGSEELSFATYRPTGQAARYLQYYYISDNPNPIREKDKLFDAGDGSEYSRVHSRVQSTFRRLANRFGYHDLFLINHRTKDIVYSVFKQTDFGNSLDQGPYAQSGLAEVVRTVIANPEPGSIQVADFQPYRPSYEAPAAFLATPIYSGVNLIGIMAVQVSPKQMSQVIDADGLQDETDSPLGETGDVYLVGPDYRMRSQSRLWVSDPDSYQNQVQREGTSEETLKLIENLDTTIGLQPVNTESARLAIGGQSGTDTHRNYRGETVFNSYGPLNIPGLSWGVIAEIETREAFQPVFVLQSQLLVAAVIFLLITG